MLKTHYKYFYLEERVDLRFLFGILNERFIGDRIYPFISLCSKFDYQIMKDH